MNNRRARVLAALLPLCLLSLSFLGGCREYKPVLEDLTGVEGLKAQFNKDGGKPRVVLLLSPT